MQDFLLDLTRHSGKTEGRAKKKQKVYQNKSQRSFVHQPGDHSHVRKSESVKKKQKVKTMPDMSSGEQEQRNILQ